jgi:hypothetical protein
MEKLIGTKHRLKVFDKRYLIAALAAGSILFGIIFPGSLSDHYHLLHFSAHFGMSFLVSNSIYRYCTLKTSMKKIHSFITAFIIVLICGAIYKLIEIFGFYHLGNRPFFAALSLAGFYASMSQNLAGMLAAFALIIYFDKLVPIGKTVRKIKGYLMHTDQHNK